MNWMPAAEKYCIHQRYFPENETQMTNNEHTCCKTHDVNLVFFSFFPIPNVGVCLVCSEISSVRTLEECASKIKYLKSIFATVFQIICSYWDTTLYTVKDFHLNLK